MCDLPHQVVLQVPHDVISDLCDWCVVNLPPQDRYSETHSWEFQRIDLGHYVFRFAHEDLATHMAIMWGS